MTLNVAVILPRVPESCFWEITDACNLRCLHCEADAGRAAPDELTTDEALDTIEQLVASGCKKAFLTGGEPLLRKGLAGEAACDVLVWPAPVEYRRFPVAAWRRLQPGESVARSGQNGDLLTLRNYRAGDSHRQIHWKASARQRKLVVRQFSIDSEEAFTLWFRTTARVWENAGQFELLCSFAATLAEDLFKQGKLDAVAVDEEPPLPVRSIRDVEAFLDRLAMVQPAEREVATSDAAFTARKHTLTFEPEGSRGVVA